MKPDKLTQQLHDKLADYVRQGLTDGILTGVLYLVGQLLQLVGVGGVVTGHVLHQRQQLLHRFALAMLVVMMLVLMGVGVLMRMGVGLAIGVGVLMAVDVGMLMAVGMVLVLRVGMDVLMFVNALVGMGCVVIVMIMDMFVVMIVVVHEIDLLMSIDRIIQ